jgi:hypothetical protein
MTKAPANMAGASVELVELVELVLHVLAENVPELIESQDESLRLLHEGHDDPYRGPAEERDESQDQVKRVVHALSLDHDGLSVRLRLDAVSPGDLTGHGLSKVAAVLNLGGHLTFLSR